MKEIGIKLKETRESMEISIEEAADDLKVKVKQIEDIENGNMDAFKDVFYLKYFIRDYSKYLGLDYEQMVDDFNEYLFDYTSKISLDDIRQVKMRENSEKAESKEPKIMSPYTIERKSNKKTFYILLPIVAVVLIAIILVIIF